MQSELNDYVFAANELRSETGDKLSMQSIFDATHSEKHKVNELPNIWLRKYAEAIRGELDELDAELLWKWWSKDSIDMQNIRVELIDILHFLISAMICAGLTAEDVFSIYQQKHAVNLQRQDEGYNQAGKTEDDNKTLVP